MQRQVLFPGDLNMFYAMHKHHIICYDARIKCRADLPEAPPGVDEGSRDRFAAIKAGFEAKAARSESISLPSASAPAVSSALMSGGKAIPGGGFSLLGLRCNAEVATFLPGRSADKQAIARRSRTAQNRRAFIASRNAQVLPPKRCGVPLA